MAIEEPEAVACTCAHLADEHKAESIVVLNVSRIAFFTDYFVIATGRNDRHLKAVSGEIQTSMKAFSQPAVGIEGTPQSGWVLIDLGGAVIHLFSPAARALYDLELLWGEAPRVDWHHVAPLRPPAPAAHEA